MTRPLAVGVAAWLCVLLTGAWFGPVQALLAAALCAAAALLHFRRRSPPAHQSILILGLTLLGLAAVGWYEFAVVRPARSLHGAGAEVTGSVVEVSHGENGFQAAVLSVETLYCSGQRRDIRTALSLALPEAPPLSPGDRVVVRTTLTYAPEEAAEPWLARHYRSENILLSAYGCEDIAVEAGAPPLSACLAEYRAGLADRVGTPLAAALLLGERDGLDEEVETLFTVTGTVHLLTFSGTHFSALAALLTLLLSGLGLHRRQTAVLLSAVTLLVMALMGFAPAVTRAGITMLLVCLGTLLFRQADPLTSLAAAALLIGGARPWVVQSAGFLLSFAAVLGIVLMAKPLSELLTSLVPPVGEWRWWRALCGAAAVSLAASLFTAPVLLALFGEVSALSLPANLLTCYPLMGVMLLGVLHSLLPLPPLAMGMRWLEGLCLALLRWLAGLPGGRLYASAIPVWLTTAGLLVIVLVCLCYRVKGEELRPALGCSLLLIAVTLLTAPLSAQDALLSVTMIDVGQGMSFLISDGGAHLLVDCGSESAGDREEEIAAQLRQNGVRELTAVVITHPHADHASAFDALAEEFAVGRLILSGPPLMNEITAGLLRTANNREIPVTPAMEPLSFSLGQSRVTVTSEHSRWLPEPEENDRSVLVRVDRGESSLLLTGDLTRKGEAAALYDPSTALLLREVDVLQIPHHGGADSASPLFLRETLPAVALISVGENVYGHPSPEVLSRLEALGSHVYRTDRDGTVQLTTSGDGVFTVRTEGEVP